MDNFNKIVNLYDIYSELFNEKQKLYFEDYYFNNLSLSEISENTGISRNAIHKSIKLVEEKLLFYEDKLKLYDKKIKIESIIDKISNDDIKRELEDIL